jgi:hypothetical protein
MNLYLDDDTVGQQLIALLIRAGHAVTLPGNVGLAGRSDPRHLKWALEHGLVVLTRNHDDFLDLHDVIRAAGGTHPGILAVRFDNDTRRDMKPPDIVRAIARLEASGLVIVNEFHVLNHWR